MFTDPLTRYDGHPPNGPIAVNGASTSTAMLTLDRPRRGRKALPKLARQAIIVAGGKGIRLRPYTTLIPKPLVPIGDDHSILEIVMRQLAEQGFEKVVLAIGHLGNLIRAYVGDGSQWGLEVEFFQETSPLGTIGPALMFLDQCPENFLVMNGDIITDIDYADLLQTHIEAKSPLTIATYERQTRIEFGVLGVSGDEVTSFCEKPTMTYAVSMGVYAVARRTLSHYAPGAPLGFDTLIEDLLHHDQHPASYPFAGYWLDIGRPDDYDRANLEFETMKSSLLRDL
jgi:NDP-sugar pyrophosphorylase family protein